MEQELKKYKTAFIVVVIILVGIIGYWAYGHFKAKAVFSCDNPLIKGNISASGEKIYHEPGQRYYDSTKIETDKGEKMFCTEKDAETAGWRKSKI